MATGSSVYAALVRLYPKDFRQHYGEDLHQHFDDLVARDGAARAWGRTTIDLVVTVPRYRLETIMNPRRTTASLILIILVLAAAGVVTYMMGFAPGLLLLGFAVVVAVVERGRLASSMRAPDARRRRHLFIASASLAAACVATVVIGMADLGGRDHWPTGRLLAYNSIFFITAIGAIVCLAVGLRAPRSSGTRTPTVA